MAKYFHLAHFWPPWPKNWPEICSDEKSRAFYEFSAHPH